jgi:hypothetical protein
MMPEREKTRPWLEHRVKEASITVAAARAASQSLGPRCLEDALAELATAGTVLALADAEWEREAARAVKNVHVRCEPPKPTETETEGTE